MRNIRRASSESPDVASHSKETPQHASCRRLQWSNGDCILTPLPSRIRRGWHCMTYVRMIGQSAVLMRAECSFPLHGRGGLNRSAQQHIVLTPLSRGISHTSTPIVTVLGPQIGKPVAKKSIWIRLVPCLVTVVHSRFILPAIVHIHRCCGVGHFHP
ncbi:hypothetical protein BC834DRAFT_109499 [Gloeopeniophorella convolvens]|nr:hypothetical protein BC834DRAFT_109499 [Gloeopeniophorella convolvens]